MSKPNNNTVAASDEAQDTTIEAQEATPEKSYSQAQLDAILKRKESKWEKQFAEMQGQLNGLLEQYTQAQAQAERGMSAEERIVKLEKDYKRQLEMKEKERLEVVNKHRNRIIEAELLKVSSKATRPELMAKLIRDRVQIDDNDKVFAVNEYDTPISLEEAASDFLKRYPEFAPAPPSGAGTQQSSKSTHVENIKVVTWQDAVRAASNSK